MQAPNASCESQFLVTTHNPSVPPSLTVTVCRQRRFPSKNAERKWQLG